MQSGFHGEVKCRNLRATRQRTKVEPPDGPDIKTVGWLTKPVCIRTGYQPPMRVLSYLPVSRVRPPLHQPEPSGAIAAAESAFLDYQNHGKQGTRQKPAGFIEPPALNARAGAHARRLLEIGVERFPVKLLHGPEQFSHAQSVPGLPDDLAHGAGNVANPRPLETVGRGERNARAMEPYQDALAPYCRAFGYRA